MARDLTLAELSRMCRILERSAKELSEWTAWGDLATETQPGAREVPVPGCLDAEVLQSRAEDLVTLAQTIVDATAVKKAN